MRLTSVTKSTCERYDLKFEGYGWATFTIDENGGLFSCMSDYGDYSYSWPRHGRKSFKHFILELARDPYYFLGKVSMRTYFDYDKAANKWKREIIERRRAYNCSREEAREAWNFIEELDGTMSCDYVQSQLIDSGCIRKIWPEPWDEMDFDKDYPPATVIFAEKIMPVFAEVLKQELGMAQGEISA